MIDRLPSFACPFVLRVSRSRYSYTQHSVQLITVSLHPNFWNLRKSSHLLLCFVPSIEGFTTPLDLRFGRLNSYLLSFRRCFLYDSRPCLCWEGYTMSYHPVVNGFGHALISCDVPWWVPMGRRSRRDTISNSF